MRLKTAVDKAKLEGVGLNTIALKKEIDFEETKLLSHNDPFTIQYSQTKVIPTSEKVFLDNRVVAQNREDPRSLPFQMLRSKVLTEMRRNNWNSLAISTPTPGSGKTLISVNLAISIAQEVNQTVLLVDMDLRKPSLHKYFGIQPEHGLLDYVNHGVPVEDILINPGIERLVILPGRERMLNSSETLSAPAIKNLVKDLKDRYESRIVIFDLPPLLVSDDAMVFLPSVDCSLMVVESGGNTRKEIEDSIKIFDSKPLLGTVLNKESKVKNNDIY